MFPETMVTLDPAPAIMELRVDAWKHIAKRRVVLSLKKPNVPTEPQVVSKPATIAERVDMIKTKTTAQGATIKKLVAAYKTQDAAIEKLIADNKAQNAATEKLIADDMALNASVAKLSTEIDKLKESQAAQQQYIRSYRKVLD
jgi:septal ring factor EnvC (AmiA/AmiB activator)